MVGFGKSMVTAQRAAWKSAYIDYDGLKQIVFDIEATLVERRSEHGAPLEVASPRRLEATEMDAVESLKKIFFSRLKHDIEKVSLFILLQQGEIADAVGALKFASSGAFDDRNILIRDSQNTVEAFAAVGVELLELQLFILLNSIGVRKCLKKYNKAFERLDEPHFYDVSGEHLHQLSYSRSISAIQSSLHSALFEIFNEQTLSNDDNSESLYRFHFVMSCSFLLRKNAEILGLPRFYNFLGRQSMVLTGTNFGGLDKNALKWLMELDPEALLQMNRHDLKVLWTRWSSGPRTIGDQETYLLDLPPTRLPTIQEDKDMTKETVSSTNMLLNLLSTFLYTVNYYIGKYSPRTV